MIRHSVLAAIVGPPIGVGAFEGIVLLDGKASDQNKVATFGRRGARPARREERAYRAYVSDEQRRPAGCLGAQSGDLILVRGLRGFRGSRAGLFTVQP